jgi:hypothetical protein
MKDNHMQVLKPGEMVVDEYTALENMKTEQHQMRMAFDPAYREEVRTNLDAHKPVNLDSLAARLGRGAVPMRRKQGVFRPRKLAVIIALAFRTAPPPALVVRFDNNGIKTTFPAAFDAV